MAGFKIDVFSGKAPKVSGRLLPDDMAQIADNVKLESGQLRPWKDNHSQSTTFANNTQTIFRYSNTVWFSSTSDVDFLRSPIAEDPHGRVYWTGETYPKMADAATATSGGALYPGGSFRLGLIKPGKPSPAITGTATTGAEEQSIAYVVTWVSAYGEESMPSDVTTADIVTFQAGQTRTITFPSQPTGAYATTGGKFRLYRTNINGEFQHVVDVAFGTTTYVDAVEDSNLGELLQTGDWEAPPDEVTASHPDGQMKGLVMLPNGIFAGFSGQTICLSEPFMPHAFPKKYQLTTRDDIVALAVIGNGLLVTTKNKPYLVTGSDSASMSMIEMDSNQSCVSKRSMVDMGDYAIYASPDGLVMAGSQGIQVITENVITRDQWQALVPSSMSGFFYEGRYVGFYNDGSNQKGFIFDPRGGKNSFVDLDFYAHAGFNDKEADKLYLLISGTLFEFNASTNLKTYKWKSKKFYFDRPISPAVAKVDADTYSSNITFKIYADGALKHTQSVGDSNMFRLPSGYRAKQIEVQLEGTQDVNHVCVYESPQEVV